MKQLEVDALAKVLPSTMIAAVLAETKKESKRERKLPAPLVVWLVIGMGLYRNLSIENVLGRISTSLNWRQWNGKSPCRTSLTAARDRLGWEAVRLLFRRFASYLTDKYSVANQWLGHEVYSLDGTCLMVPDSKKNEEWFGRPRCSGGRKSAFPQLRAVMLVGAWTHVVAHAVFGPYATSEMALAEYALSWLRPGSIVLVDRAYYGFRWATLFARRKAHFIVRMKQGTRAYRVKRRRRLAPEDWLCVAAKPKHLRRSPGGALPDLQVRVILCKRQGFREIYLMTDLLDATKYPAQEIALLFRVRWEAELSYREMKVYLAGKRVTFRTKKPDRVLQEAYGLLLAYNCVRAAMCEAAVKARLRPTEFSFSDCLHRIRLAIDRSQGTEALVESLLSCRLPLRRVGRSYVRAVKLKLTSNFPRKRTNGQIAASSYLTRARQRQRVLAPSPMA
jgi:hypothetical protein